MALWLESAFSKNTAGSSRPDLISSRLNWAGDGGTWYTNHVDSPTHTGQPDSGPFDVPTGAPHSWTDAHRSCTLPLRPIGAQVSLKRLGTIWVLIGTQCKTFPTVIRPNQAKFLAVCSFLQDTWSMRYFYVLHYVIQRKQLTHGLFSFAFFFEPPERFSRFPKRAADRSKARRSRCL